MSTAAVSASLNHLQSYFETRNSDVQQLGQALQSGNLEQAQIAYNNITAVGQGGPFANGNAFRVPQRQQDFDAIGQALQSGNLAGAQSAFAALKSTFQQGPVLDPPAPAAPTSSSGSSGPEIVLNLSNGSGGTAAAEQITINIGQTSGGDEQVSLSVGDQGSNAQQVTLNLNPNSNEQIVLNLLNGSSASGSTSGGSGNSGLSVSA